MSESDERRRARLAELAQADPLGLANAWDGLPDRPGHSVLKAPETGLIMVRGRIGGGGAPFNMGEATMTRCVVQLGSGEVGFGHVLGRSADHARTVALFDALAQVPGRADEVDAAIAPLAAARKEAEAARAAEIAATRVEFFTMARGE